jgi:capsular exopolysaccharide synthesis family protein
LASYRQQAAKGLLAVTSATSGEGKTTVAANLAVEFANSGKKTLLIDADLSRGGLTKLLELAGPRGLSRVLGDVVPIAESARQHLIPMPQPGLDVLPAGPPLENVITLGENPRFAELLDWAVRRYDQILIDTPSLFEETHLRSIAELMSGVLLVVQPKRLTKRTHQALAEHLKAEKFSWLGIVGNRITSQTPRPETSPSAGDESAMVQ